MSSVSVILHNIRSVYNVGSIFRTADAIGVKKVYLTGYTPAPVDRFGRIRADFSKVSLGAEKQVLWETHTDIHGLLRKLRKKKGNIIAVEQSARSMDYKKVRVRGPTVLVFGNETAGIQKKILARCDSVIEIPMRGKKESLNVSVAAGIVLFRLFDKKGRLVP